MTTKCYTCSIQEFWTRKGKDIVGMVSKISAAFVYRIVVLLYQSSFPDLESCMLVM